MIESANADAKLTVSLMALEATNKYLRLLHQDEETENLYADSYEYAISTPVADAKKKVELFNKKIINNT